MKEREVITEIIASMENNPDDWRILDDAVFNAETDIAIHTEDGFWLLKIINPCELELKLISKFRLSKAIIQLKRNIIYHNC